MASKRHLEAETSDEPVSKRATTFIVPATIGSISSLEEMDMKALLFKNKKLWEKIEQRRRAESELMQKIESLEAKQSAADATLSLVNRQWSQLDENLKITSQRLGLQEMKKLTDSDVSEDEDAKPSFVRMLAKSGFLQVKEELGMRVDSSRQTFAKIIDVIITTKQKNEEILKAVQDAEQVESSTKGQLQSLTEENIRLQQLVSEIQAKHHSISLENKKVEQEMEAFEDKIEDMETEKDNLIWELQKARKRENRLNTLLTETMEKLKSGHLAGETSVAAHVAGVQVTGQKSSSDTNSPDSEDLNQMSEDRLKELEEMRIKYQESLKTIEKLRMETLQVSTDKVLVSPDYRTLKAHFSVLFSECSQLKVQNDECRALLQQTRTVHTRQIEQMEADELQTQKKLRNELIQLEDTLAKVRHDYEMLHVEFEQNLAANEQAGPINREMRHLINSLQNHNRQLKGEIHRSKRKITDLTTEINKLKKEDEAKSQELEKLLAIKKEEERVKLEAGEAAKDKTKEDLITELNQANKEINEYKQELNKLRENFDKQTSQLASFESMTDERREIAEVKLSETKHKTKVEELKKKITSMEEERNGICEEAVAREKELLAAIAAFEKEKGESGFSGVSSPETQRKIKVLEETIAELRKAVTATKQEEEALLAEMDVTGQAFEDMQEQNIRLVQQLREKDDANFKLMSERIKANQIHKLLQEEKDVLQDQALTLHTQVEAQNQVVRKLEEKERSMQMNLMHLEKELSLSVQATESHRKKVAEVTLNYEDQKRDLENVRDRLKKSEESLDRKIEIIEEEHFKLSRALEDCAHLRRKLDRQKKNDMYYNTDEILLEEIKEYKTKLRCPCCNVNNKDAVLTKCFHVFCHDCIKRRYDTRQRKCPKCNAGFGGNDFHRIYIE